MNAKKPRLQTLFAEDRRREALSSLSDLAVTNFEMLKFVSAKSSSYFEELLTEEDAKRLAVVRRRPSCHENRAKIYLIFDSLTAEQRAVFDAMHDLISDSYGEAGEPRWGSGSFMDAGPGTGKTHVIASIAAAARRPCCYVVYTVSLQTQLSAVRGVESYTVAKFMSRSFNVRCYDQNVLWSSKGADGVAISLKDMVYGLLRLVERFKPPCDCDLLILDEYTVLSPWIVVLFYCLSLRYDFHILYVGDRNQQNSLSKSAHHRQTNYTLLHHLCDRRFELTKVIRQRSDAVYARKLDAITRILNENSNENDVLMNFKIKYAVFELFARHFLEAENFDALYMAQFHMDIKRRMRRMANKLGARDEPYCEVRFCKKEDGRYVDIDLPDDDTVKFPPYLLLVPGAKYFYAEAGVKRVVTFAGIERDSGLAVVRDGEKIVKLARRHLSDSFMHPEHVFWIKGAVGRGAGTVYQYPLRFYASTYHAAQGLTLDVDSLEVNLDAQTLNSVYVGLTRIRSESRLGKIHSHDLPSFLVSKYFDDGYFYRICPQTLRPVLNDLLEYFSRTSGPKRRLMDVERIPFKLVTDEARFKTKHVRSNVKILRTAFKSQQSNAACTDLVNVCKMLKNNRQIFDLNLSEFTEYCVQNNICS